MSDRFPAVKGTQSLLGEAVDRFRKVISNFEKVRDSYGFRHVELPVFEKVQVFARSIGETTDIVSKEMYTLEDKNGELLALRPEFTAGIVRAYLSEGWQQFGVLKLSTHGPVFRYERPQRGRFRQFNQVDAEIIGSPSPDADIELLAFAHRFLQRLGVWDDITLRINTLGDSESRARWRSAVVDYLRSREGELSHDSQERLGRNPLRILDSKNHGDRVVVGGAPKIDNYLSDFAASFYEKVLDGLRRLDIHYTEDRTLVRGLDYYTHTAFEFETDALGAQGTVIGGGRYDGLIEALGGKPTPAVGWAGGVERLAELARWPSTVRPQISLVPDTEVDELSSAAIASALRRKDYRVEVLSRGSFGKRMARADTSGSELTIVVTPISPSDWPRLGLDLKSRSGLLTERKWQDRIANALRPLFNVAEAKINERFDLVVWGRFL